MTRPTLGPTLSLLALAALALAGCGADGGTTAEQDAAFKSGVKPTISMPPGSNKPPANFKSSLDTGSGPRPPAGVAGPGG